MGTPLNVEGANSREAQGDARLIYMARSSQELHGLPPLERVTWPLYG